MLTERVGMFVQYWIVHRNGARAAREAGYAEKYAARTAYALLKQAPVRDLVQKAMDERAQRLKISQDDALILMWHHATDYGRGSSHQARVYATHRLFDHLRMYPKDALELTGKDGGPIQTQDMSMTEISRRIAFVLQAGVKVPNAGD